MLNVGNRSKGNDRFEADGADAIVIDGGRARQCRKWH